MSVNADLLLKELMASDPWAAKVVPGVNSRWDALMAQVKRTERTAAMGEHAGMTIDDAVAYFQAALMAYVIIMTEAFGPDADVGELLDLIEQQYNDLEKAVRFHG